MKTSSQKSIIRMTASAMCIALAYVLPFLTGNIPQIGNMLCPMHIPVLLCGFVCGAWYGLAVGAVAPLLRSFTLGAPPLFPMAFSMAFELSAYGFFSGFFHHKLPKKLPYIYISLIASMLLGRAVWGVVRVLIFGLGGAPFGWAAFLSGAFTTAIPGIVIQILLIPVLVISLKKSKIMAE